MADGEQPRKTEDKIMEILTKKLGYNSPQKAELGTKLQKEERWLYFETEEGTSVIYLPAPTKDDEKGFLEFGDLIIKIYEELINAGIKYEQNMIESYFTFTIKH